MSESLPISVSLIGGTNGKTTTVLLLEWIFSDSHVSSMKSLDQDKDTYITPIQEIMEKSWVPEKRILWETWSLGWKMGRYDSFLESVPQSKIVSLITNITQDHGHTHDYNFDAYVQEKWKTCLFSSWIVIHASLEQYYPLYGKNNKCIVFGLESDFGTVEIIDSPNIIRCIVSNDSDRVTVSFYEKFPSFTCLIPPSLVNKGIHNVYNLVGAWLVCMLHCWLEEKMESFESILKIKNLEIETYRCTFSPPPGRYETMVTQTKELYCISDYAHNPGGIKALLEAVKNDPHAKNKTIWCIFGCSGEKDIVKRPMMYKEALSADRVVITSDHYREPFLLILETMLELPASSIDLENPQLINPSIALICENRIEAIRKTLDMADPNNVIVICNMGTDLETVQVWDDEHVQAKYRDHVDFSILISGDVIPHKNLVPTLVKEKISRISNWVKEQNAPWPFLRLCNLEGTVQEKKSGYPYFAADPDFMDPICDFYNVIGLANNHAMDYGQQGLENTRVFLESKNTKKMVCVGAKGPGILYKQRGQAVRVAVFAYTLTSNLDWPWILQQPYEKRLESDLGDFEARFGGADLKIMYLHWGTEYKKEPTDEQIVLYSLCKEFGFDLVVGCHAHLVQSVHMVGQTALYGLGNTISNHETTRFQPWTNDEQGKSILVSARKTFSNSFPNSTQILNIIDSHSIEWPVSVPTEQVCLPTSSGDLWLTLDKRTKCSDHFIFLLKYGYLIDTQIDPIFSGGKSDFAIGGLFLGCDIPFRCMMDDENLEPSIVSVGFIEHAEGQIGSKFMIHWNRGRGLENYPNYKVHWFATIPVDFDVLYEPLFTESALVLGTRTKNNCFTPITAQDLESISHGDWLIEPNEKTEPLNGLSICIGPEPDENTRVWMIEHPIQASQTDYTGAILVVPNKKHVLYAAARIAHLRFGGTTIRITGSSGKTTTRVATKLLLEALESKEVVHSNILNHNNTIGVSQTLLNLDEKIKYLVVEMGISEPGEMALLTSICHGDCNLVTNVQHAHEKNFTSWQHLYKEKMEITRNGMNAIDILCDEHGNPKEYKLPLELLNIIEKEPSKGRQLALKKAIEICTGLGCIVNLSHIQSILSRLDSEIPRGRAHLSCFSESKQLYILDDTYNGNPHSIANMIQMCDLVLDNPNINTCIVILAQVAECDPENISRVVHDAIHSIRNTSKTWYFYCGGEMMEWINISFTRREFLFTESVAEIQSLFSKQCVLAVKGTGLFKKDPKWKMWEWLDIIVNGLEIE